MELDHNDKFQIEENEKEKQTTENIYGSEIGSPPLVVVVQGGKNV